MKLAGLRAACCPPATPSSGLCDWVRNYVGEQYSWDVQLVLAKDEVPAMQLGRAGRLGWTTWLKTKPFDARRGGPDPATLAALNERRPDVNPRP